MILGAIQTKLLHSFKKGGGELFWGFYSFGRSKQTM